jgi:hypothetical protein
VICSPCTVLLRALGLSMIATRPNGEALHL